MTTRRALAVILELAMLAASLRGGPVADSIRIVAVVVVAALGALVVFVAAVFPSPSWISASRRTRSDRDVGGGQVVGGSSTCR